MKLTSDQFDEVCKIVQEKYCRDQLDINMTDTFDILWAARKGQGCELSPTANLLTPAETEHAALEIIREHAPHLLPEFMASTPKSIKHHSKDVLQCMAELRLSIQSLGRSIDGAGDRGSALDLASEVRVDIDTLIDLLRESL